MENNIIPSPAPKPNIKVDTITKIRLNKLYFNIKSLLESGLIISRALTTFGIIKRIKPNSRIFKKVGILKSLLESFLGSILNLPFLSDINSLLD